MYKISIPKPCFQSWENMTASGQGRYCSSCAKTVVDFTRMSDKEVNQYFISNREKQICGHFNNSQLHRIRIDLPANIFKIKLPAWKKFLVAFLVIYGATFFSIDTTIAGTSFSEKYGFLNKGIFSQGEPSKTPRMLKEKKKRKHKRRLTRIEFNMLPTWGICIPTSEKVLTTDGYTQVIEAMPIPEYLKSASDTVPDVKGTNQASTNQSTTGTEISYNVDPLKKEPVPEPANPLKDTVFVLPQALAPGYRSWKKKKA